MTYPTLSPAQAIALCWDRYCGTPVDESESFPAAPTYARTTIFGDHEYCFNPANARVEALDTEGNGYYATGREGDFEAY